VIDPVGLVAFQRLVDEELAEAKRRADEEDQRMYDALQGKPFWRTGPAVEVTGLAQWPPVDRRSYDTLAERDHYDNVKPGVGRGDE
jgi:hypothetical protein